MRSNAIQFAVVREDPEVERQVMRGRPVERALLVASGGCTALSLQTWWPDAELRLLHAQFGPGAEPGVDAPQPGCAHMFCTPSGDALDRAVRGLGFEPMATATVLQVGMPGVDWSFVLTSDI